MTEERKLVTVLFADVVGSTALGASHDPEVVRRTLSRAFAEVRRIIESHGGSVEKFIGDAVMAVFGIPRTHDDDADRAVRAAFALRERIAALNADGRIALELRIGVNSGQVVTGDAGETLVTGEAVNAGSRIQAAAAPGEILVGALTHQLTDRAVRYGPAREIEAKGIGRVTVWPATALTSTLPAQHRGIAGLRAPLVGRDDELRLLLDSHRKVASEQRAALVTIFGNAGVGKSRLVAEFADIVGPERIRRGRCLPYGEGITFWPVVEILRADAGITAVDSHEDADRKLRVAVLSTFTEPSDDADAIARRLSVLAGTARREDALPDIPAESVQQELRWGLRRFLERRAASAPLTIVFDDIHWAEPALLDLIEHLAEWSRAPLFLLCMARPDLRELRAGWGGGLMNASAIRLEPLTPDESARLIRELLAIDALPEALRREVITRSEGNPLYVEEFLRMLLDAGHVTRRDDRFVATGSISSLVLPATLQGLIAARLDTTPAAVKQVLQRAAVIGKVFWREAITAQGPIDGQVDELLLEAARRDLVSELDERGLGGGRAWTFKHILIRDVAYDAIPKAERARAHDAFGRWLESAAGARLDEYAEIVTHHAEQAFLLAHELGEPDARELGDRARARLLEGGTRAQRRGDLRAALAYFRRALAVADATGLPSPERTVIRALIAHGRSQIEPSAEVLDEIGMLAAELRPRPPVPVLVDLLRHLSFELSDKDAAAAAALDREAIDAARSIGDPELVAAALLGAQWLPWVSGDLDGQREALAEAQAHVERTGAERHLSELLIWLAANAAFRGVFEESVRYAERSAERAAAAGSPLQRALALRGMTLVETWRGRLDAALAFARQGVEAATDAGARQAIAVNRWFLGDILDIAGDLEGARDAYARAVEELAGKPSTGLRAEARTKLAKALVRLGRTGEARAEAETARSEVAAYDAYTLATTAAALGAVSAAEGRPDEADRLYRDAIQTIGSTGYAMLQMDIRREYARFLIEAGRADDARSQLERVREFYDTPATPFERERTEALLRRCATMAG
ncbi:MAG TPA: adenylate/guanylate cyclase domain-containing protein [Candidatus Limnocylindria bacterium]|nr:adenylate/guanylate cyclase domain-containing protein [Candidatus Limnocylindria bacterium]